MIILSGDWPAGTPIGFRYDNEGHVGALILPVSKFTFDEIGASEIRLVAEFTSKDRVTLALDLDWGLDSILLSDPTKNLAEIFGEEAAGDRFLVIQFFSGKKLLLTGDAEEIEALKKIQYLSGNPAGGRRTGGVMQVSPQAAAMETAVTGDPDRLPTSPFAPVDRTRHRARNAFRSRAGFPNG